MKTNEKRRAAVRQIIKERFEGRVVDFARAIERSPAQVWQFMNARSVGEKLARDIEEKLGLPQGALDGVKRSAPELTADELRLVQEYRRSKAHWRSLLQHIAGIKPSQQHEALAEALVFLIARVNPRKRARRGK